MLNGAGDLGKTPVDWTQWTSKRTAEATLGGALKGFLKGQETPNCEILEESGT